MKDPNESARVFILPACMYCIHGTAHGVCMAYPSGIPARILTGRDPHFNVQVDQDGGTIFEQDPTLPLLKREKWSTS